MKLNSSPATPAHRLRDRLRDAAHEAILEAAEAVFARDGMDAPMEAIAAHAGVAVGTLYNHFDNRAALLEALLAARRKEVLDAMSAALEESRAQPFPERLQSVLRALVAATEKQLEFRRLMFQADVPMKRSRRAAAAKKTADVISVVLEEGQREGFLAPDPEQLQPIFLTALIQAAIATSLHAPERMPLQRIPVIVSRQFLDGARARSRS